VIQQLIQNDVSSTKIRLFLRREMSVQYLIPSSVIEYIEDHNLYEEEGTPSHKEKGKLKETDTSGQNLPATGSSGSKS
jgi:nicotinamide mononucleotide adenylyltransferase